VFSLTNLRWRAHALLADVAIPENHQSNRLTMAPSAVADLLPSGPLTSKSELPSEENHVHGMEGMRPLEAISHGDVMLPGIPKFDSFAAQRQWQLEHMAAAFRHWSREGFVEGMSGHISVRDPEHHDVFWTNPVRRHEFSSILQPGGR